MSTDHDIDEGTRRFLVSMGSIKDRQWFVRRAFDTAEALARHVSFTGMPDDEPHPADYITNNIWVMVNDPENWGWGWEHAAYVWNSTMLCYESGMCCSDDPAGVLKRLLSVRADLEACNPGAPWPDPTPLLLSVVDTDVPARIIETTDDGKVWLVDMTDGAIDDHGVLHYERTRIKES